ncbi:MAG: holin family protein [Syntrophales bacterium]
MDITGIGSIFDFGTSVINKIFPDKDQAEKAKLAMLQLQQEGAFKEIEANLRLAEGQMKINEEQAKNPSIFVSGARPAIMWVCVLAYAFNYLLLPLANWGAKFYSPDAPVIVALETGELTTLLFGLLGIGTLRTVEKLKGVASK